MGNVLVRGRVRAALVAANDISVTAESEPVQLIAGADDVGHWRWMVDAPKPGLHVLHAQITVLRGDTNEPLITPQEFDIQVKVIDTFGSWLARTAGAAEGMLIGLGGLVTGAASTIIAYLVYRHQRRATPTVADTGQPRKSADLESTLDLAGTAMYERPNARRESDTTPPRKTDRGPG